MASKLEDSREVQAGVLFFLALWIGPALLAGVAAQAPDLALEYGLVVPAEYALFRFGDVGLDLLRVVIIDVIVAVLLLVLLIVQHQRSRS